MLFHGHLHGSSLIHVPARTPLTVRSAKPPCGMQTGGFALAPRTMLLRQQVGSSGPSNRSGNILEQGPRSDPTIIHPRGRGVCRRQEAGSKRTVPRQTRAAGSGGLSRVGRPGFADHFSCGLYVAGSI